MVNLSVHQNGVNDMERKKKDKRIHLSTLHVMVAALLVGLVALTVSYTYAWGERMKGIEETASASVFEEFETETLFGEKFTQEELSKAKVTAFNVWETTCPACLSEMGALEKLSHNYPEGEFQLVGICDDLFDSDGNLKQSQLEKAQSLMNNSGTTFPHIIPTKEMEKFFTSIIPGYPTTFFVDQNGKILSHCSGAMSFEQWVEKVDGILAEAE